MDGATLRWEFAPIGPLQTPCGSNPHEKKREPLATRPDWTLPVACGVCSVQSMQTPIEARILATRGVARRVPHSGTPVGHTNPDAGFGTSGNTTGMDAVGCWGSLRQRDRCKLPQKLESWQRSALLGEFRTAELLWDTPTPTRDSELPATDTLVGRRLLVEFARSSPCKLP